MGRLRIDAYFGGLDGERGGGGGMGGEWVSGFSVMATVMACGGRITYIYISLSLFVSLGLYHI